MQRNKCHKQMPLWSKITGFTLTLTLVAAFASPAHAAPVLQLYVEGAEYKNEQWHGAVEPDKAIRVWAIGNTQGPQVPNNTIHDVRMAISYDASLGELTPQLTPATTGGLGGFTDPSVPQDPVHFGTFTDGSTPQTTGQGQPVAARDVYGDGRNWAGFQLGDFDLTDSPIADFISDFPEPHSDKLGQINVYEISFDGAPIGTSFNFDLYGHTAGGPPGPPHEQSRVAPYSHTANIETLPSPSAVGGGLIGVAMLLGLRGNRRRERA